MQCYQHKEVLKQEKGTLCWELALVNTCKDNVRLLTGSLKALLANWRCKL